MQIQTKILEDGTGGKCRESKAGERKKKILYILNRLINKKPVHIT